MIGPYGAAEAEAYQRATQRCGRPIVLSLSPGRQVSTAHVDHLREHAQMWRVSDDLWDSWADVRAQFARMARWAPFQRPGGTRTTIAGRDGYYVPQSDQGYAMFSWPYAPDAWASVSCSGMPDPRAMIERVTPRVRLVAQDLRIPFTLSSLPAGYDIKAVYQRDDPTAGEQGIDLGDVENDPGIDRFGIS